jgi:dethiobiotin synthetase
MLLLLLVGLHTRLYPLYKTRRLRKDGTRINMFCYDFHHTNIRQHFFHLLSHHKKESTNRVCNDSMILARYHTISLPPEVRATWRQATARTAVSTRHCFSTTTTTSTADVVAQDPARFWKKQGDRYQRPIFIAATKQHVGKTTTSLAIISGLQKRFDKVGFLKPVGQQHVDVHSDNLNETLRVDKDVWLVREHFHLDHIDYEDMSPVIIPNGYTKKYVDGKIRHEQQLQDIEKAMRNVTDASDIVVCEGTGHCAVGSIVNVNNAKVASMIGADMVLIANGGLGKNSRCTLQDLPFP